MTVTEFSNEFDVLIDSYRRFKDFDNKENLDSLDFNEYEKSIFLTQAQEDIVKSSYNGANQKGDAFENTEEVRRYLNELVKTQVSNIALNGDNITLNSLSVFFELPNDDDLWFIVYESAILNDSRMKCSGDQEAAVIPTKHDSFQRVIKNPFRQPNERRVLRLDVIGNMVELISKYTIKSYTVRYISKPDPIILTNLPDNLKINGESQEKGCNLNSVVHRSILERAVQLALQSRVGTIQK